MALLSFPPKQWNWIEIKGFCLLVLKIVSLFNIVNSKTCLTTMARCHLQQTLLMSPGITPSTDRGLTAHWGRREKGWGPQRGLLSSQELASSQHLPFLTAILSWTWPSQLFKNNIWSGKHAHHYGNYRGNQTNHPLIWHTLNKDSVIALPEHPLDHATPTNFSDQVGKVKYLLTFPSNPFLLPPCLRAWWCSGSNDLMGKTKWRVT